VKVVIGVIFIVPPIIIAATAGISFLTNPDPIGRSKALKKFSLSILMAVVSVIIVLLLNAYVYDLIF
jgi:uncharacterized membrane protein YidH (DUF202 family)